MLGKIFEFLFYCFHLHHPSIPIEIAHSPHTSRTRPLPCENSFNYASIEVALSHKQARMAAGGEVKLSNEDFQRNLEDQNDEVGLTCDL